MGRKYHRSRPRLVGANSVRLKTTNTCLLVILNDSEGSICLSSIDPSLVLRMTDTG